ncbi:MAG: Zn-ribbon domain-containing protein [Candidatus Micrarchaeota archaeon]|nr:Zn-ribbon domain-containing protein [Candidatus Micrarchaeota archaeon]
MHICLKCKRVIYDIKEIENGCSCGSKIFIYKNSNNISSQSDKSFLNPAEDFYNSSKDSSLAKVEQKLNADLKESKENEAEEKNFESILLARDSQLVIFDKDEVENIRQIQKGVFEVNLFSLQNGPVVVKDEDEVYYVRLPFENKYLSKHQK